MAKAMSINPVVVTRELTKDYGSTVGVMGLNLEIRQGEIFGFLGPNGSGKTTTIRLLLDLIRPTRGRALLFGSPAGEPSVRGRTGYLPGELALDGRMTGTQTLAFLAALNKHRPTSQTSQEELCLRLGLFREDLGRRVRDYSRGMKQKLGLISAFQHKPELLILDEPTTGLDPLVRETVFDLMAEARESGVTIFHSSHVLSEVDRTCDRVGVLRSGELVALLTVEEARRASARIMVVDFEADPPLHDIEAAGVSIESMDGRRVVLRVEGELRPLLALLAQHSVRHLSFPESSIEDAFNAFYMDQGRAE
jgi:ABC-2 type transport system ATP-binding protein